MTITNGYTSLNVYKQRFYDEGTGDTKDDAAIEAVIEAVSREIDHICWQRFFTTASFAIRYFTAEHRYKLFPDQPIALMSTLATDDDGDRIYENDWTITDFDMMPFNAIVNGEPYKWIETTPNGDYTFPVGVSKGVKVTAKFGWSSTPLPVVEACLLGSHRLMARRHSPLGVSGAAALGNLTLTVKTLEADPEFMSLLQPYIVRY
ncbi:MAG: hypothetical protein ACYTBJ_15370 [Planctomycetota bacterium]|jgi:hypothetical protein